MVKMGVLYLTFTHLHTLPKRLGEPSSKVNVVPLTVKFKAQKLAIRHANDYDKIVEAVTLYEKQKKYRPFHSNFPFRFHGESTKNNFELAYGPLTAYQYAPREHVDPAQNPYGHFQQLVAASQGLGGKNATDVLLTEEIYFLSDPVIVSAIPAYACDAIQGLINFATSPKPCVKKDVTSFLTTYLTGNDAFRDIPGAIFYKTLNVASDLVTPMYLAFGWSTLPMGPSIIALKTPKVHLPLLTRPSPRRSTTRSQTTKSVEFTKSEYDDAAAGLSVRPKTGGRRRVGAKVKAT